MSTLTLDTRVRQHPDQIAAEADGEVLMMHIASGSYFGLNEVASFIWNALAQPRSVGELCAAVTAEFEVDEAECRRDVLRFVQSMLDDGLAETSETAGSTAAG